MTQPANNEITLELISQQKAEVLRKIRSHQSTITSSTKQLFAPLNPVTKQSNGIMKAFNTGMVMFDGLVIGLKIFKGIRRIFK